MYEIKNNQFIFIKRAVIIEDKIYNPTIFFDSYPKNEKEKFCLIVGGNYDGRNNFKGWQINLHFLI